MAAEDLPAPTTADLPTQPASCGVEVRSKAGFGRTLTPEVEVVEHMLAEGVEQGAGALLGPSPDPAAVQRAVVDP